ncbi:hypothetical protein VNO80_22590 [Phaseolus coccineus]|uniref:Uncharacterized protein n=1 Tax=Phaseolus coccineus TaxID=3886 RepID=A0AAN9M602_PHACN
MKEPQTTYKTYARSLEKWNRGSKDPPNFKKIANKCLNAALTSISEAPVDSSSVSEISYANTREDVNISLVEEGLPETLLLSEKIIKEVGIDTIKSLDAYELDSAMSTSIESEIAGVDLRNAKPKVLKSHNDAPQHKRLEDEITKYVIEDLYAKTVLEDFDRSCRVMSAKNRMVFLCFCIWLIGVLAIFLFPSDIDCLYKGPLPT